MKSEIIKLIDKNTNKTKYTVWYRTLKKNNNVVYSGAYSICELPNSEQKCLKVVFPLPNGNATVILKWEILADGSLKLSSDGKTFGENGFYFTLKDKQKNYWARFVDSLDEWITVYEDADKVLRADHDLSFLGIPFLKLHYKMQKRLVD